jgi:hypothetical protein
MPPVQPDFQIVLWSRAIDLMPASIEHSATEVELAI